MAKYELLEVFHDKNKAKKNADFYRKEGYLVTIRRGDYGFNNKKLLKYGLYIGGFRRSM